MTNLLCSSSLTRSVPHSLLCVAAAGTPPLEQPLPLLKQEPSGYPQSLCKEHRVGLARHVGGALALDLPYEPPGHAGPLGELLDAPAFGVSSLPHGIYQHGSPL